LPVYKPGYFGKVDTGGDGGKGFRIVLRGKKSQLD